MSIEEIKGILLTEDFLKLYDQYIGHKEQDKLLDYIDNIETNKKYYRMNINKNKRYAKSTTEDTSIIKDINREINKLTDKNYNVLKPKIVGNINSIEYIIPYVLETIFENSILHHIYVPLYVGIIKEIKSDSKNRIINKLCDTYYQKLFNNIIESDKTEYEKLCLDNKNTDNIIGFSLLLAHLEKETIINGYIDNIISSSMGSITTRAVEDQQKLLISFQNISQIYFDNEIPEKYKIILLDIKKNTKSSKINFKIMDILEL
tara:strand:- start:139 stop:921 length:783 start_codon:yes stop_codon:yes gene_type:complete